MSFQEILTVFLAFLLYQPIKFFVLGHNKTHPESNDWSDLLGEREKSRLRRLSKTYGNAWFPSFAAFLLTAIFYRTLCWYNMDPTGQLRIIISIGSIILTWKAATMDIDLATGDAMVSQRLIVIFSGLGVLFFPGFLFVLLFGSTQFFRCWTHHQHLVIRCSLMFLAGSIGFLLVSQFATDFHFTASGWYLILVLIASHYIVPGISKIRLGPSWRSWVFRNQLNSLVGTAYLWGWARFMPQRLVLRFVNGLKSCNIVFQALTLLLEVSAGLILFDQKFAVVLLVGLAIFHLSVFLLSGIMFWQNIIFLCAVAGCLMSQIVEGNEVIFGLLTGSTACCLSILLPLGVRLWRPHKLAWWDTPFIDRADWLAEGVSGKIYGLYNDFMSPNDRLFGNRSGFFLTRGKRITKHLGQTRQFEVADAIYSNTNSASGICEIIEQFGEDASDTQLEQYHDQYMRAFFTNFNRENRKAVCPRWAKAPGDQYYYWGENERFRGQEKVRRIIIRHRQELLSGDTIIPIKNELIKTLKIAVN